ncbi:Ig-like domain-containing protein [Flavobacterium sp.]
MKKLLHLSLLFLSLMGFGQAPIYQFNFDGTLTDTSGTITLNTTSPVNYFADRNGNAGGAGNCSSRILTATMPNLPQGNAARTVSFWARTVYSSSQPSNFLFAYGSGTSNNGFGYFESYSTAQSSSGRNYTYNVANNIDKPLLSNPTNSWHHYVIIHGYNGNANRGAIFIDGVLQADQTRPTALNTTGTNFVIGQDLTGTDTSLSAAMDDLRIYNVALTQTQVTVLHSGMMPAVTNPSATNITNSSATINYTIDAFGQNVNRKVFYSDLYGNSLQTPDVLISNNVPTNYSTALTALVANRRYNYFAVGQVAGNTSIPFGSTPIRSFTTTGSAAVPVISGVSVGSVTLNSVVITYSMNPNGSGSASSFIGYQSANGGGSANGDTASGTTTTEYTETLTGLSPNTTYTYEVWAQNSLGESIPITGTFTTAPATPAPTITNVSASNVNFNSATINYNLNAFGSATTYAVEYTTDVLAQWQTQNGGTTSVNTSTPFQVQLAGLTPNETYFVRVKAINTNGQITTSSEIQFNTPTPIVLTNVNDSNVSATTAQINYTLNTNGYDTLVELRYQAGTFFDSDNPFTTITITNSVSNTAATNYTYTISGLTPNTTYSYQFGAVSANAGGAETGENAAFTTLGISAQPTAASPQTFCQTANPTVANLSASGSIIKWYAAATGGSPLASTTALTQGTYYVTQTQPNSVESTRLPITVNITIVSPPSNVPANQVFCQSATLGNIQTGAGSNFNWYAAPTGGAALPNSTAITTSTYYLSQTIMACESPRTAVSVTVNLVNAPTAQAQTFCQSGTVANLIANGTQLKWYASQTAGVQLASSTALATGTYYVSQTNTNCESTRTPVSVTVNVVNAPTAATQSFCQSATVADLVANGTGIKWYSVQTGGAQLASNTALTTATYYVSQTVNNCESSRTAVTVEVNQVQAPIFPQNQSFCNSATFSNIQVSFGANLKWFANATGGTPLANTTALTTGTYYASQTVAGCESPRTAVSVTVTVVNAPTGNASQSFTQGATIANLSANGTAIVWFSSQNDAASNTNPLPASTILINNNTYYAVQTINGCRSNNSLAVTVTVTLSINDTKQLNFSLYPNPALEMINVDLDGELESIKIYSLQGQRVIFADTTEINVSNLASGIYIVKVQDMNGAIGTQKLIIK